jgi:hypothetical protein
VEEEDAVTDTQLREHDAGERTFTWHPEYRGRTVESVERELTNQIMSDQRQYELALSGAEKSEHQALASVMELEKRWSVFTFDWADTPPEDLARRIVDFELARDRWQEMISYNEYRAEASAGTAVPTGGWRASMTDAERRRVANIGAVVIMVSVLLVIIVVLSVAL